MSRGRGAVRHRLLVAVGAGMLLLGAMAGAASAAPQPVPASLSGLTVAGQNVTGSLTIRAGQSSLEVDLSSVTAEIGGTKVDRLSVVKGASVARTTMLVIDTSGSMGSAGMAAVRSAVASFLSAAPRDVAVGVVSFANTAGVDLAPTTDHAKVQHVVNELHSSGDTALFDAVKRAVETLGSTGDRSIVLLSDGGDTVAPSFAVGQKQAVAAISAKDVRVEVVRFKTPETKDGSLEAFAAAGGGSVAAATDSRAVTAAFTAAAKVLDSQVQWAATTTTPLSGRVPVVLRGTAGGRPFVAQGRADFGAGTPTPSPTDTPSATTPSAAASGGSARLDSVVPGTTLSWALVLSVLLIFVGVFGLVVALVAPVFRSRRKRRVSAIEGYTAGAHRAVRVAQQGGPSVVSEQLVSFGDRVMAGRDSTSRTMELIERADLPWRAGEWFVLRIVSVVVAGAAGFLVLRDLGFFGLLLGLVVGAVLPAFALRFLARRRARKFESLLPDVLTLVATSLASGFSLLQALDAVARDSAQPAAKEFSRALAETRIGADMTEALEHMATRMDSENMRWTAMAIRIQREVGGNLAETLRTTSKTLRERESLLRQVRALSAEGRLSAYILIALPIGIFLYSCLVNYDYVSLLWTRSIGLMMLVAGVVAMGLGILWMRKVVKIEV